MNNEQFRKLMLANSAKSSASKESSHSTRQPAPSSSLGSRSKPSIPMTPRSVGGQSSFARQLAEQRQTENPSKKFKASAPKGVKLASGYVDRAKTREQKDDGRAARLKALEQSLKDEEIDQATFDRLRYEIAGGDLESTHLVKGLDFKLLERVRKGEDVYSGKKDDEQTPPDKELDIDDEFDRIEDKEVQAIEKERTETKKGQLSTIALAPGKKRTRDQILAEMKAARQAAKAKTEPALGNRFRKIGGKQMPGSRIERDSKGREVLIIVNEDGHEKRKVRKIQPGATHKEEDLAPDPTAKPLGMEIPEQYRTEEVEGEEDEDVDIFEDVGDDYDPLAGMNDSDDDSDDEEKGKENDTETPGTTSMPPPPKPQPVAKQNYFQNSKTGLMSEEASKSPSISDPAIMAAIKRASALRPIGGDRDEADSGDDEDEEAKKAKANEERRKRLLENTDRDAEDMDMGFGTSRYEDEEDFDDQKIKLSKWGEGDDDHGGEGGGKSKRKRGPKKRKGDVNSAADVLRVMEQRKNK